MSYAATIGFFDGVHRGHRYLIGNMQIAAMQRGLQTALITFEQHPRWMNAEGQMVGAELLTTFDERTTLLKSAMVNQIFCFQYPVIRDMKAREFLEILRDRCDVRMLMIGYDHHFGSDHAGIREVQRMNVPGIEIVELDQLSTIDVSSSKIRRALHEGDIEHANEMLGYPYTLIGEVVHGKALGRTIGYPTANIALPEGKLIPKKGVYAIEGGILNIGDTIEAHFLSDPGDIYGKTITVSLQRRLRDEQKFNTLDELKAQIRRDIEQLTTNHNS